ncbi:MAG: hypothetical protein ACK5RC_12395 [Curvibacter sp.]
MIERYGERGWLVACGLLIGLLFGVFAQRSRFCLRALLSGLTFAVIAQAALPGSLAPLRSGISS